MTVIIFLIVLAVLIFVHELGHFLAARAFGIRVDAFKIGFGPKLFKCKRGETEYGLNLIPFGGYVKIFGEDPDAASTSGPDAARSFVNKARWKQAIVLVSGVLFNFIFAWLLYIIVFASGTTVAADDFRRYADSFKDERVMVTYVMPDSPADKVGLKYGDIIRYVETTAMNVVRARSAYVPTDERKKQSVEEIQDIVNSFGNKPVAFEFERNKSRNTIGVTPVGGLVEGKYAIGIAMKDIADVRIPFVFAIWEGFRYTLVMIRETAVALYTFIANIVIGQPDFADVAGPIGIAGIVGSAAKMGMTYLLMITAIISINLGVVNLIPFPALDGGRILFVAIESATRRRIPAKFSNIVNFVGFALLMILMVVVTFKDIVKIWR